MNRKQRETAYFAAVKVVSKLKSKLFELGALQTMYEDEINKATAEVVRCRGALQHTVGLTDSESHMARNGNRLGAIKCVRERLPKITMIEARDLVEQFAPTGDGNVE